MQHSPIGASGASIWTECSKSILLSRTVANEASEYAKEGNAAHDINEIMANHFLATGEILKKDKLPKEIDGVQVTDEMLNACQIFMDYIVANSKGSNVSIERLFHLDHIFPGMFGTNDALIYKDGHLEIIDYKHGRGVVVEPEDNLQLIYYALGALGAFPHTNEVTLTIIQPRAPHSKGPIRSFRSSVRQINDYTDFFKEKAQKVYSKDAEFKIGPHCRFCNARKICPEFNMDAIDALKTKKSIEDLNSDEIAAILKRLDNFKKWIKDIEDNAFATLKRGEVIPGYKLVKKRSRTQWKDENEALDTLNELYGERIYKKPTLKTFGELRAFVDKEVYNNLTTKSDAGLKITVEKDNSCESVGIDTRKIFG